MCACVVAHTYYTEALLLKTFLALFLRRFCSHAFVGTNQVGPIIWKSATNGYTDRLVSQLSDPPMLYAKNSHHWCEKQVSLAMQKSLLALERWAMVCFRSRWELVFPGRLQKQLCGYVLDLLRSPDCWRGWHES